MSATDMAQPPMRGILGFKRLMAIAVPITYGLLETWTRGNSNFSSGVQNWDVVGQRTYL